MELLERYKELERRLHDYFGYQEDWHVYAIQDHRDSYWHIRDGDVEFADKEEDVGIDNGYSYEIRNDRFLPKSVYVGVDYTMILVDTHTDGNQFLAIFSNAMRV